MIKSARFNRGIRTVIATATIAGTLTLAFSGSSFAASSRGAGSHTTRNNVRPDSINRGGGWGSGQVTGLNWHPGQWVYNTSCHCMVWYGLPVDLDFIGGRTTGLFNQGTDHLSNPVAVVPQGTAESAQTFEVYGKSNVLQGVNLYKSKSSNAVALVQSLPAPSGANGVTLSAGSNLKTPEDVITFAKDGVAIGEPFSIPAGQVDAVDTVIDRQSAGCSDGFLTGPIEILPTIITSTGGAEAGRPTLLPCKAQFPTKLKLEK